jgi:hypothetical protein
MGLFLLSTGLPGGRGVTPSIGENRRIRLIFPFLERGASDAIDVPAGSEVSPAIFQDERAE